MNRFKQYATLLVATAILAVTPVWEPYPAFSQTKASLTEVLRCTREDDLVKALMLLQDSQYGRESFRQILGKSVKIVFKDMKTVHKALKNYDALSWLSSNGQQVIFINEKHRGAPPEALAAMIAHEALHDDPFNSIHEEIEGWRLEALVWMELKRKNPALSVSSQNALVIRENKIESEHLKGTLAAFVRSSPGYQGLPEISPGFGPTSISSGDALPDKFPME
jgi:hypothetical protein